MQLRGTRQDAVARGALFTVALGAVVIVGAVAVRSRPSARPSRPGIHQPLPPSGARSAFEQQLDTLSRRLLDLASAAERARGRSDVRSAFRAARTAYKRTESLLCYYSPSTAAALNGPAPESDGDSAPSPLGQPSDFQRIAAIAFRSAATITAVERDSVATIARSMQRTLLPFRGATALLDVSDTASLDALRLELARVSTLGIAGFDAAPSSDALRESADAIDGARSIASALGRGDKQTLIGELGSLAAYLRAHDDVDTTNRLQLIVGYVRPAAQSVLRLRRAIDSSRVFARRAWIPNAATPYDSGAFDAWAFAPEYAAPATREWIELGERLFYDVRLSGDGSRSCATCHQPLRAFTDGMRHAPPIDKTSAARLRNTPTLLNVGLEPELFADQRAGSLEDQARIVLANAAEMHSSADSAAARARRDSTYRGLFAATHPASNAALDERAVRMALAAYLRSLQSLDSRFDRAVRGDTMALSASERRGFTVFMGKARCATCHFAPLFSGVMPPDFTRSELEIIGAPSDATQRDAVVDADSGRAVVDGLGVHRNAFKVPTLRNVAVTAPYMHNGVFATLEQVVAFYDAGGGVGIGERIQSQTLSRDPLRLDTTERRDLIAFLRSLTDTSATRCRAVTIPWRSCRPTASASAR